ncbi:MAG TPA: hypothetical protein VM223_06665, partial [Planctomycetota bacterium]|nr:hypothetical protein [Planctomycetota bacterium]
MANVIEVVLRAKDQMSGQLKGAEKSVGSFNKKLLGISAAAGIAATGTALAMRKMIKEIAELGDLFAKTEARTGIAADTLSRLHFVSERAGSSFESLVRGFKQLSQTAYDAERGMATYLDIYNDLGVSVTTAGGQLKDMETLLFDVADAISKEENATKKAAIATRLFGRAGQELIPLLSQGREGFRGLMEEADALGAVMSRDQALAWEKFTDSMTDMSAATRGLKMQFAGALAPAI